MPKVASLPTVQEILQLPVSWQGSVQDDWIDENGHMNIRYYIDIGGYSTDKVCRDIGIDNAYRSERRMGVFTAEQHVTYLTEMHLGTNFTAHVRMVDISDKVGHMISMIVNADSSELACIYETVLVHVDMDTRRSQPFPDDVSSAFSTLRAEHEELKWQAPTSGSLGIRKPS